MRGKFSDTCAICHEEIPAGVDVVPHKGGVIHRGCAPGADDVSQQRKVARPTMADAVAVGDLVVPVGGYENIDAPTPVKAAAKKAAAAPKEKPAIPHVDPAQDGDRLMVVPEIPAEGLLLENLDEPTYHAHEGSVSVSGLKVIRVAPALFKHEQEHRTERDEFDYGSAAHLYVLGVGPEVVELMRTHPDGTHTIAEDKRSPSVGEHADAVRAAGKLPLMAKDHAKVKAMADQIRLHPLAMKLLEKGTPEVSAFKVDSDTGVMRRGRADHLRKRVIVDYKSAVDADPVKLGKVAHSNGWYMQAPFYRDLFTDVTGVEIADFLFIVQQSTAPYLVSVVRLPAKAMDLGARHYAEALQRFRDCTDTGLWPGYQADGTITALTLPGYAHNTALEVVR